MSRVPSFQWLLVGGPLDGRTVWHTGVRVTCSVSGRFEGPSVDSPPEEALYEGRNWLFNGRLYRIGVFVPKDRPPRHALDDPLPSRINDLIRKVDLQHIAGS